MNRIRPGVWAALAQGYAGLLVMTLCLVGLAAPAQADIDPTTSASAAPKPTGFVGAWLGSWSVYNLRGGSGVPVVNKHGDLFNEVDLFWNHLSPVGHNVVVTSEVTAARSDAALDLLHGHGYQVFMTITDGTGPQHLARAIRRPALRANTLSQLVATAADPRIDGIDLDLEGFAFNDPRTTWAPTRRKWIPFIARLAAMLHAQGKELSVTIPPVNDWRRRPASGYWVYAANVIQQYADHIKFMMYDYSYERPGPISPINWVRSRTNLYKRAIPVAKLQLGVPAYGRDWVARRPRGKKRGKLWIVGKCPVNRAVSTGMRTVSANGIDQYLAGLGLSRANLIRDKYGESTLRYSLVYTGVGPKGAPTSCRVFREAHLSDDASIQLRAQFAKSAGLHGVAIWHVGAVSSAGWNLLGAL